LGRRRIFTLKLTDEEYEETKELAKKLNMPMTEIWRTYRDFSKIFYSEITLSDALMINEKTIPIIKILQKVGDPELHEVMRPFKELMEILRAKRVLAAEAEVRERKLRRSSVSKSG